LLSSSQYPSPMRCSDKHFEIVVGDVDLMVTSFLFMVNVVFVDLDAKFIIVGVFASSYAVVDRSFGVWSLFVFVNVVWSEIDPLFSILLNVAFDILLVVSFSFNLI